MRLSKPKVFILSFIPPLPAWGSAMTFYRHFVERNDFEVRIATDSADVGNYDLPYEPMMFDLPRWWKRMRNTRFHKWVLGMEGLHGEFFLPRQVMEEARRFRPDVVFTMAGSWNWVALAAQRAARILGVPLAASFNDWYDYPWLMGHERQRKAIEQRFRRFYRDCDLALCTSDGMKEALGPHPNAHVWYPSGAVMPEEQASHPGGSPQDTFTVLFAGSLGEWYGPMLEELVTESEKAFPRLRFRIFGGLETWSQSFHERAVAEGIFGGRISFEYLQEEAQKADILLLPMGFDPSAAHIESTSFKTKFLDYLTFRRPIVVWGPEYCSAVRVAREFDSACCVTTPSAMGCAKAIEALRRNPPRRVKLVQNAERMYQDRFHPDKIHGLLVRELSGVARKSKLLLSSK
jgi:glycosyltransferase involved in cell wall biosynthesis